MKSVKRNAILNVIKQGCTILFPLITLPYVTRVLGKDGLGKYSFASSVTGYFVLIAALGIQTYAVREGAPIRDSKEKIETFGSQVFSINVWSSLVAYILLAILLMISSKIRAYMPFILIQSSAIILALLGAEWINSIYEDFLYITIRYISIQCICLVLTFLLVKNHEDLLLYTTIVVFAANGGYLVNLFYRRKYCKLHLTTKMEPKKHLPPMLFLLVNALAIMIYVNSDITMLGFYYDDDVVGVYSFAARIYNMVKSMIAAAIAVALPRVAYIKANEKSRYDSFIRKIFSTMTMFAFPMIAGLACLSKEIIYVVGGEEYLTGTTSLIILSAAIIFALYAGIVTNCVLVVNGQEKICMISTLITAGVNVLLNLILIPLFGIEAAAITTVVAEILNMLIQAIIGFVKYPVRNIVSLKWITYLGGTVLVALICRGTVYFMPHETVWQTGLMILCAMVVSVIVYICLLLLTKNEDFRNLLKGFGRSKK